jgi:hypothetical protein
MMLDIVYHGAHDIFIKAQTALSQQIRYQNDDMSFTKSCHILALICIMSELMVPIPENRACLSSY